MVFSDPIFLILFLPLVVAGFHICLKLGKNELGLGLLVAASLFFYAFWDVRYLALLLGSVIFNFLLGKRLLHHASRLVLIVGIGANLGLLGYYKYTDLFLSTLAHLQSQPYEPLNIILPLAISFFTFQQIAYLVDCYRSESQPTRLSDYSLFVVFFPQLIAGPIVHHKEMLPQFNQARYHYAVDYDLMIRGVILIVVGLFKKVMIADQLAAYVDPAFANVAQLDFLEAWTGLLAYTLQLYFDFSAYGEIAMGIGYLFGFKLPLNFNSPYRARSIADFWRRWHITLGRFIRDYVYIPLGGNQQGLSRMLLALIIAMALGGLWHGAGWHFVMWGLLHGAYLAIYALWSKTRIRLPAYLAMVLTFIAVMLAWVLFRAESVADALTYWGILFGAHGFYLPELYAAIPGLESWSQIRHSAFINGMEIWLLVLLCVVLMHSKNIHEHLDVLTLKYRYAAGLFMLTAITAFNLGQPSTFLYFQF
jgi:D-alanyl-lipoteichoic acid acyltransferase DltB (MBOAT superfamily)